MPTDSEIEIRPVFEAEDFGAEFTPALREQEVRLARESRAARQSRKALASHNATKFNRNGGTMLVQPYLMFDGRCEEAVEFYKKALGANVEMLMRYKDAPEPPPPGMVPPGLGKQGHARVVAHRRIRP